jgi:hypothetical protein
MGAGHAAGECWHGLMSKVTLGLHILCNAM